MSPESSPRRWRFFLITWVGGILLTSGLIALNVKFYVDHTNDKANLRTTRADLRAARAEIDAQKKTADTTKVAQCFQSVQDAPAVATLVSVVTANNDGLVSGLRASLSVTPPGKLHDIREASLARALQGRRELRRFQARLARDTPTRKSCIQLARSTGVDVTPFLQKKKES